MTDKWSLVRRRIWSQFQHYRRIRALMLNLELKKWSPDLLQRIDTELIPLIELEDWQGIYNKTTELNDERILERFK